MYLIFDKLELSDLINIVQINSEFQDLATNVFRRKYSNYEIDILATKCDHYEGAYDIIDSKRYIKVRDVQIPSNIMKYFGNYIQKLAIRNFKYRNYTSGSDWAMVNRVVNEYGSELITQLSLGEISRNLWPHFTKPFSKVEKLDITIEDDTDGMKLTELCPNLRELHISVTKDANYDFIDCELPHLVHLDIRYRGDVTEQMVSMIRKNPQIRRVVVDRYTTPSFYKVIAENLANLEHLTLTFIDDYSDPLHFKSVKHCVLHATSLMTLTNLTLSQLESLETSFWRGEREKFTEFFRRHRNLKRLNLSVHNTQLQLDVVTADLVNLVEMNVETNSEINVVHVIKFIEIHPMLLKFKFNTNKIGKTDLEELRRRFELDWHIENIGDGSFLFEKKQEL